MAHRLPPAAIRAKMSAMPAPPPAAADRPTTGPRYYPLAIVLVAAAAGILFDRHRPLPLEAWWGLAVAGVAAWGTIRLARQLHHRPRGGTGVSPVPEQSFVVSLAANTALLLAVAAAAGAWHHCRWNLFAADDLGLFARRKAEPTCVEAIAVGRPRELPPRSSDYGGGRPPRDGSRLSVDLVALRDGAEWRPASGRATLLVLGDPPPIEAGDRLRCFARFSAPAVAFNPGSFDRAARLRSERVLSRMSAAAPQCVSVIAPGNWWNVWRLLDGVRAHGNRVLEQYLDPRQSELAGAVLLGLREELDSTRREAFLETGTVHILAISGLHVGILAMALFWIMLKMPIPRGGALSAVAILTLLYALMVDAHPSVIRATVLVLVACAAMYFNRRAISTNSLAAAALVVLALNPTDLLHVGPQLSFLCVAALIWFAPQRPHYNDEEMADRTIRRLILENLGLLSRMWLKCRQSIIGLALAGRIALVSNVATGNGPIPYLHAGSSES